LIFHFFRLSYQSLIARLMQEGKSVSLPRPPSVGIFYHINLVALGPAALMSKVYNILPFPLRVTCTFSPLLLNGGTCPPPITIWFPVFDCCNLILRVFFDKTRISGRGAS